MPTPSHYRRAVAQVLVQANAVVEKLKLIGGLDQIDGVGECDLAQRTFEAAEKPLNKAIFLRRKWSNAAMPDAQSPQAELKLIGNKSTEVVSLQTFWFAEDGDQLRHQLKHSKCAFLAYLQRQTSPTALIDHADQNVRSLVDMHIGKIQSPRLVRFLWARWFFQRLAQLDNLIVRVLAQVGDIGLADRFAPIDKGVKVAAIVLQPLPRMIAIKRCTSVATQLGSGCELLRHGLAVLAQGRRLGSPRKRRRMAHTVRVRRYVKAKANNARRKLGGFLKMAISASTLSNSTVFVALFNQANNRRASLSSNT